MNINTSKGTLSLRTTEFDVYDSNDHYLGTVNTNEILNWSEDPGFIREVLEDLLDDGTLSTPH